MSAFWQALLAAPSGPAVQLVPYYTRTIDDRDRSFISYYDPTEWTDFDHGAFLNSTLSRLPPRVPRYEDGTYPGFSFPFATSGLADEGFDICGVLEGGVISVYANDKLITTATGYAGGTPTDPPIVRVRCGPGGLPTRRARYTIRVDRALPVASNGNGQTFYLDFLRIFSRALS